MITSIIRKHSSLREKIKNLGLYLSRRKGARNSWNKRHRIVHKLNPDYYRICEPNVEKEHSDRWSCFSRRINPVTLRITNAISGISDPRIVPEEVFQTDIEPTLNPYKRAHILSNKSYYNRWFRKGLFPEDILHKVNGEYLDASLTSISTDKMRRIAENVDYPIVIKPSIDSYGGHDVRFVNNSTELITLIMAKKNMVVQEKMKQHSSMEKFYDGSLNTVRAYLYKSSTDNRTHFLHAILRVGINGSLDNLSAGGLASYINEKGQLHGYALDRYGTKYIRHPGTGEVFDGCIPDYDNLKSLSIRVAKQVFNARIIGLDLCYDFTGTWRLIEINTQGHSIRLAQYAGFPFFGGFTDEVIDYCKANHWALRK